MANIKFQTMTPYDQQMESLARRQKIADMLQQQSMDPLESQTAPGGMVVPTSPVLGLIQMLKGGLAGYQQGKIGGERQAAETADKQSAMDFYKSMTQGKQNQFTPDQALEASMSQQPTEFAARQPVLRGQDREAALMQEAFAGGRRGSQIAQAMLNKPEPKSRFADPNMGDYTPGSAKLFEDTGDPSVLVRVKEPEKVSESSLARLYRERDSIAQGNPNDPRIPSYNDAIKKETTQSGGVNVFASGVTQGVADGRDVFFQPSTTGGAPRIVPGVAPKPTAAPTPTQGEAQDAYNVNRVLSAINSINDAIEKDPSALQPSAGEMVAGFGGQTLTTLAQSPERQIVSGSQADMIDSLLTLATGASYTEEQMKAARKSYLPMYGEDPATLADKQNRLRTLVQGAKKRAGRAWTPEMDAGFGKAFGTGTPAFVPTPAQLERASRYLKPGGQ